MDAFHSLALAVKKTGVRPGFAPQDSAARLQSPRHAETKSPRFGRMEMQIVETGGRFIAEARSVMIDDIVVLLIERAQHFERLKVTLAVIPGAAMSVGEWKANQAHSLTLVARHRPK